MDLRNALMNNDYDTFKLKLTANIDKINDTFIFDNLNAQFNNYTILEYACVIDNNRFIKLLLNQKNININYRSKLSRLTPLHFAVMHNKFSIVKILLLKRKLALNIKSKINNTPYSIIFSSYSEVDEYINLSKLFLTKKSIDLNKNMGINQLWRYYDKLIFKLHESLNYTIIVNPNSEYM